MRSWMGGVAGVVLCLCWTVQPASGGLLYPGWVQRQLTNTPGWSENDPMFSPNGAEIVFTRSVSGANDIYKMASDGSGPQQLLALDSTTPSYTRDGLHILYPQATGDPLGIWRMDTDGANKMLVAPVAGPVQMPNELPDGRIVFLRWVSPPMSVWIMNGDGSGQAQISVGANMQQPRVSPDGRYVVYHSQAGDGTPYDIFRYDLILGTETQLTFEAAQQGWPSFSPDGKWIVYQSKEDGGANFDIWVMASANPTVREQLNDGALNSLFPQFRPDGSGIVFSYGGWGGGPTRDLFELQGAPEPASLLLLGGGIAALVRRRRRR